MEESILGMITLIVALTYNIALFVLNLECAHDRFVKSAVLLMSVNTLKDMTILTIVLYNVFLG